jgi:P-type E1-E2 ATPase
MITASVGDGANDVPMLHEAHLGIGIYGQEGMQAVQNADFAIGQFRFLWRLLLVHGRLNYIQKSDMILYCMFKNAILTFP